MGNKKNKGVKKGKESGQNYLDQMQQKARYEREQTRLLGQCETEQLLLMALGRMLSEHHTQAWLEKFYRRLDVYVAKTRAEYWENIREEAAGTTDKDRLEVNAARVQFDRELAQYMGGAFAGWDYRWDEQRHTWGLRTGRCDNLTPEEDEALKLAAEWTVKAGLR